MKGDIDMNYQEKQEEIIEMIKKIEKIGVLEYLCTFIKLYLKKWG